MKNFKIAKPINLYVLFEKLVMKFKVKAENIIGMRANCN